MPLGASQQACRMQGRDFLDLWVDVSPYASE